MLGDRGVPAACPHQQWLFPTRLSGVSAAEGSTGEGGRMRLTAGDTPQPWQPHWQRWAAAGCQHPACTLVQALGLFQLLRTLGLPSPVHSRLRAGDP